MRQREKHTPCKKPNVGLDPRTPGSQPEPKADAQHWATQASHNLLFSNSHPMLSLYYRDRKQSFFMPLNLKKFLILLCDLMSITRQTHLSCIKPVIWWHQFTWSPATPVPWHCEGSHWETHWIELIFCYLISMKKRNGSQVVENKTIDLAWMCCWLRFVYATFGKDACWWWWWWWYRYYGKRRKLHQIHIPLSCSLTSGHKLDLLCDLIIQPLSKGETCNIVNNDPWELPGWLSSWAPAFGSDHDPRVLG